MRGKMYWVILAVLIGVLLFYLFLKKRGNLDFWKLITKFPDDAYDFFEKEDCWIVYIEEPSGHPHVSLPVGNWDGPFKLAIPKIGKVIDVFGRVPDYHDSQKRFINQFGTSQCEKREQSKDNQNSIKSKELNLKRADAYMKSGMDKGYIEDNVGAMQDFSKAIELDPSNFYAYVSRAMSRLILGDETGAMQDMNKAIELNPKSSVAYLNRGRVKNNLKDYWGAIQDFDKAIELNYPRLADAYLHRGLAKISVGQNESGCLDLSKAGEMGNREAYDLVKKYYVVNKKSV